MPGQWLVAVVVAAVGVSRRTGTVPAPRIFCRALRSPVSGSVAGAVREEQPENWRRNFACHHRAMLLCCAAAVSAVVATSLDCSPDKCTFQSRPVCCEAAGLQADWMLPAFSLQSRLLAGLSALPCTVPRHSTGRLSGLVGNCLARANC